MNCKFVPSEYSTPDVRTAIQIDAVSVVIRAIATFPSLKFQNLPPYPDAYRVAAIHNRILRRQKREWMESMLSAAISNRSIQIATLLVETGVKIQDIPNGWKLAIDGNWTAEEWAKLCQNQFPPWNLPEFFHLYPLHFACLERNYSMMKLLLSLAPEIIDRPDVRGWTPLHYASKGGSLKIVQALIEAGAKSSLTPCHLKMRTPIGMAVSRWQFKLIRYWFQLNPSWLNRPILGSQSAIEYARSHPCVSILQALDHQASCRSSETTVVLQARRIIYFEMTLTYRLLFATNLEN